MNVLSFGVGKIKVKNPSIYLCFIYKEGGTWDILTKVEKSKQKSKIKNQNKTEQNRKLKTNEVENEKF